MSSHCCARAAVSLAVLLLVFVAAHADESALPAHTTKYLPALRKASTDLQAIQTEIKRLLATESDASKEREKEIRKLGERFYTTGVSFKGTLDSFLRGATRRGLSYEIDLVRYCVRATHEMLVDYRRLIGAAVTEDKPQYSRKQLDPYIRDLIRRELQRRIAERFDDVNVRYILTSESGKAALGRTREALESVVFRPVEKEVQRLTGLAFHDARSMRRAIKQAVSHAISRNLMKLIVTMRGDRFLVLFGKHVLIPWAQRAFWSRVMPRIKEAFRGRGRQRQRLLETLKGMEALANRLRQLPKDAKLRDVQEHLRKARVAVAETTYLRYDLERTKTNYPQVLDRAIDILESNIRIVEGRFLLNKESAINALRLDREVLVDTLDELAQLLRREGPRDPGEHPIFFLAYFQFPGERGPVEAPDVVRGDEGAIFPLYQKLVLMRIDRDLLAEFRAEMRRRGSPNAGASVAELYARNSYLAKEHKEGFVLHVVHGDQSIYYHHNFGNGRTGEFGKAQVLKLKTGKNKIPGKLLIRGGLRMDVTLTIVAPETRDILKLAQTSKKRLDGSTARYPQAAKEGGADLVYWAGEHYSYLNGYASFGLAAGRFGAAEGVSLLRQMLKANDLLLKTGGKASAKTGLGNLSSMATLCRDLGTTDAYSLAGKEILQRVRALVPHTGKEGLSALANLYKTLTHLAISSSNNVDAARRHLKSSWHYFEKAGEPVEARRRPPLPERW